MALAGCVPRRWYPSGERVLVPEELDLAPPEVSVSWE